MINKKNILVMMLLAIGSYTFGQSKLHVPASSAQPSKYQLEQIKRKYGMFVHFGINTFHNEEWTDGSKPASSYSPTTIDAKQWVATAKNSGMKYIILVAKHHDGFCLWDSKYTEYDVANSGNKTNVVAAIAKECEEQGIRLGLYYSLWDRKENGDVKNVKADFAYNKYMLNQINELLELAQKHTKVVELWLDGGWEKENYRWPIQQLYSNVKERAPQCQVGVNWTIGSPKNVDQHPVLPNDQQEYFPIRYFPSDFRLGDPYIPKDPDPKLFVNQGQVYYMPFETTVVLGKRWFYHTDDNTPRPVAELADLYHKATAQDNILILNVGPNREGRVKDTDVDVLQKLKVNLGL